MFFLTQANRLMTEIGITNDGYDPFRRRKTIRENSAAKAATPFLLKDSVQSGMGLEEGGKGELISKKNRCISFQITITTNKSYKN